MGRIFCLCQYVFIFHDKDGLYQYIPNVFAKYDAQELSYSLEKLFRENRDEFWKFYQKEIHMKE